MTPRSLAPIRRKLLPPGRSDSPYEHVLSTLSALHVTFIALASYPKYFQRCLLQPLLLYTEYIESIPMAFPREKKRIPGANAAKTSSSMVGCYTTEEHRVYTREAEEAWRIL